MSAPTEADRREAEFAIAALAINDAKSLKDVVNAGITAAGIHDEYARRVFTASEAGFTIYDLNQAAAANISDANYYGVYGVANVERCARKVEFVATVKAAQEADKRAALAERIMRLDGDEDALTRELHGLYVGLRPRKLEMLERLEARRISVAKPPPPPETRFFLAGKKVATPGNLVNIIARAKSGKTAGIGGLVAAAIASAADNDAGVDALGFTASNPAGKALVLIDTEQSTYDAYGCYQRALKRANADKDPEWLLAYSYAGWSAPELREALPLLVESASDKHGGVFAVIIDGVADFIADPNDAGGSNELVSKLQALAIRWDCPVVCVIHANEGVAGGDDGRGHLGKQLTRKGESNLVFKKAGEITTVTSEKQRNAPITPADGIAFKWCDHELRHVSCASAKKKALLAVASPAFGSDPKLHRAELERRLREAPGVQKGPNGPYRKVDEMLAAGVVVVDWQGLYELVK